MNYRRKLAPLTDPTERKSDLMDKVTATPSTAAAAALRV